MHRLLVDLKLASSDTIVLALTTRLTSLYKLPVFSRLGGPLLARRARGAEMLFVLVLIFSITAGDVWPAR
jgi:hypothetical protein